MAVVHLGYVKATELARALNALAPPADWVVTVSADGILEAGTDYRNMSRRYDFLKEAFVAVGEPRTPSGDPAPQTVEPTKHDAGRRSGLYAVEIRGNARSYTNLKNLLSDTVERLSALDPGFMDRLHQEKARSRRLVSRERGELFDKQHLAEHHAIKLANGWWMNTNNSTEQVKRWLNVIARCANLSWNRDIKISF